MSCVTSWRELYIACWYLILLRRTSHHNYSWFPISTGVEKASEMSPLLFIKYSTWLCCFFFSNFKRKNEYGSYRLYLYRTWLWVPSEEGSEDEVYPRHSAHHNHSSHAAVVWLSHTWNSRNLLTRKGMKICVRRTMSASVSKVVCRREGGYKKSGKRREMEESNLCRKVWRPRIYSNTWRSSTVDIT